jgi:hypothetical protein
MQQALLKDDMTRLGAKEQTYLSSYQALGGDQKSLHLQEAQEKVVGA